MRYVDLVVSVNVLIFLNDFEFSFFVLWIFLENRRNVVSVGVLWMGMFSWVKVDYDTSRGRVGGQVCICFMDF